MQQAEAARKGQALQRPPDRVDVAAIGLRRVHVADALHRDAGRRVDKADEGLRVRVVVVEERSIQCQARDHLCLRPDLVSRQALRRVRNQL